MELALLACSQKLLTCASLAIVNSYWVISELEDIWTSQFLQNKPQLFQFSAIYLLVIGNKLAKT